MLTPTTVDGPMSAPQYDVDLRIGSHSTGAGLPTATRTFPTVLVVGGSLRNQSVQALVGRDILQHCLFVYDGQAGTFVIAV